MRSLLWVDDEPNELSRAMNELRRYAEGDFAASIDYAVQRLREKPYDAVILDITVPMSPECPAYGGATALSSYGGLALLTLARSGYFEQHGSKFPHKSVIVCSGSEETFLRSIDGAELGDVTVIPKPLIALQPDKFIAQVLGVLHALTPPPDAVPAAGVVPKAPDDPHREIVQRQHDISGLLLPCIRLINELFEEVSGQQGASALDSRPYEDIPLYASDLSRALEDYLDDIPLADNATQKAAVGVIDEQATLLKNDLLSHATAKATMLADVAAAVLLAASKLHQSERVSRILSAAQPLDKLSRLERLHQLSSRIESAIQLTIADTPGERDGTFDAIAALYEMVRRSEPEAAGRKLDLQIPPRTEPFYVLGNPRSFKRMIQNLLQNAIKYNAYSRGTPTWIEIAYQMTAQEIQISIESWGHVEVTTSGRGFNANRPGQGLGLEIVNAMLKELNGTLRVERKHRGKRGKPQTTFIVILKGQRNKH